MELTTLRYLRAIASHGHLTRAAKALGVTQPALSASLRKLEGELGTTLAHRTPRGIELTDAGRLFLRHTEDALRAVDEGVRGVRQLVGLERGSIRVGGGATATSYLLPRVVSMFRESHPMLTFYVREAGSGAVASAVLSGELDLGIVTLPIAHPQDELLVRLPLVEDELRLIRPAGAGPGVFRWRDLARTPFVAFEGGTAVRTLIDRAAADHGVTLDVVMELRSIEGIKSMVSAGIGVGIVSRFALGPDGPWGEGATCRDSRLTRTLAIIRRRDREPGAAAGAFEEALTALARRRFEPAGRRPRAGHKRQ